MTEILKLRRNERVEVAPRAGRMAYHAYTGSHLDEIRQLQALPRERRFAMRVVSEVLPFRVNQYVIDELIDWDRVPEDPIFQLTFPQPGMLAPEHFERIAGRLRSNADRGEIRRAAHEIRLELNPHPADQRTLNVPRLNGVQLEGLQHKYRETVLFFPSQGQTCHAYCTFCFRWPQFVAEKDLRICAKEAAHLQAYLSRHPEVTDVLITGGDPMVMKTAHLARYIEPLLHSRFEHLQTIRIGTKALTYWPYRFVTDADADELLRLFERVVNTGRQLAFMAHVNHWRELDTGIAREAIRRVRATGAMIRTQAPLLAHVNDDPKVWSHLWRTQAQLGMFPYYMFVERDTGARRYFEVPLVRAWEIYRSAMQSVSGLARTARGPSMSAGPGKVEIQGVTEINGERVFVLRFIQARNPAWVQRPFYAGFNPEATWLDDLKPALGEREFFYESEYEAMRGRALLN